MNEYRDQEYKKWRESAGKSFNLYQEEAWNACWELWQKMAADHYVETFHPEFGSAWASPDGECVKAYELGKRDALSAKFLEEKINAKSS